MSQARFVHIVDEVPELEGRSDGPVLVVALEGFLDAGNASRIAVAHLQGDPSGRVVASLEIDEFYDYRARRPPLTFLEDRYADYVAPRLVVRLLEDQLGAPYLLLSGPEPDFRWEGFARAVRAVVEHFGVRLVVSLGSVPMAVPHTRPVQLTNHANAQRLLVQDNVWKGEIRVPASAQALLEVRLGEWGHDAMGFVAHIPHYVAQFDYPGASAALVEGLEDVTGLQWDTEPLREAGEARQVELATQIADSDEVREVVHGLEQQYDAFHTASASLLAEDQPLPSGEELGEQFEQFLARLEDPEE
ncbi:Predicted ATP-dependent carboligase, ATP-grasp superfamily [Nocardioides scoriae]|uniref:Predicted ATP-dependent carboligase, ATP-grasp superfamily n=1 Tax=Nocardioides scoriae TaxID=642780 RepID=A0A1H1Q1J3_9ACTN|nr:PAC2 family protein [Nocardioides scoriae]SDS17274.1 Predicted ATP-dependent carboligase, ATP-grasp superfamily [Nocardioides scoriae]